ncbi:MAG: hypothetical protein MRERV_4c055 [Mycoplasmataceae bacterium RV_VA103A]|nr:MAG: hypothetical protein MRERV_11c017 [Mycoplasmataceae bacterium RV_VA103A]KLL05160.1 MAG: hypothetical protein MRERV_4c055 [Mycoplasmataceae bacterium RV_VA103A]
MNKNKELIKQIEIKIKELKTTLTLWTKNIEKYNSALIQITQQLNENKSKSIIKKASNKYEINNKKKKP